MAWLLRGNTMKTNARFWTYYHCDWVKLTLAPGQSFSHFTGQLTDEGFWKQYTRWSHEGDHVREECLEGGRDCDGYHESEYAVTCSLDRLKEREAHDGTPIPDWEKAYASQIDHAAEAAGY
jgi:hypothetical protein